MDKNLILHIGGPKTGTTALQLFLARNRQALIRKGFCYPGTVDAHWGICTNLLEHSLDGIRARPHTLVRKCLAEIGKSSCLTAVLSAECFAMNGGAETLRELIPRSLPVTVVYYARRQDFLIESWYNQTVKSSRFRERNRLDEAYVQEKYYPMDLFYHDRILTPWAEAFGRENIRVRCFEHRQMQGDIIADFTALIGLAPDETFRHFRNEDNASLDLHHLEFIRLCSQAFVDDPAINNFFAETSFHQSRIFARRKNQHLLPPEARIAILDHFEESNQRVARDYLGRPDGRLFYDPRPDPSEPWEPYLGLTADALVPVFGELLTILDRQQQQTEPLMVPIRYLNRAAWRGKTIVPLAIRQRIAAVADRLDHEH